ncbi:MAG: peptide deformylase [Parasporobacterium sp.]|nr:peptide deformylase [Parasporobacterium sp.]
MEMAIRQIREDNDPILRKKSKPVKEMTSRNLELIQDMIETMHDSDGVGLAAVQTGVLKRIAVVWVPDPYTDETPEEEINDLTHSFGEEIVMVNPVWEAVDDTVQTGTEGCLSVPGKYGTVTRPGHIILKASDADMVPYELEAMGLLARAICHECDHLDGILYTDKVEGELMTNSLDEDGEEE